MKYGGRKKADFLETAQAVIAARYPKARCAFVAGSIVRGEATRYSDIDLVVVFDKIARPARKNIIHNGWPIEIFVHDPETLNYFFYEFDAKSGCPALPQMVSEGITIPNESTFSRKLKRLANKCLRAGPPRLSALQIANFRYGITDLVDDLREPRSFEEALATGTRLYPLLADFALRSRRRWSGGGKSTPKALKAYSPQLAREFHTAFDALFSKGTPQKVIRLAEKVLRPSGGFLFEGYGRSAPKEFRKRLKSF